MKAAVCTQYGSPEVIEIQDLPKPVPRKNQILVKVMATAVNSGDVRTRSLDATGLLKFIMRLVLGWSKPRRPILGTVFSGIVEEVGACVSRFKAGEQVFGMTGFRFGTHAEYVVVQEKSPVLPMPKNAGFEEAAALIFGGQTAIYYLSKSRLGQWHEPKVMILGATGSVGTAAIQLAKSCKALVTAVCGEKGMPLAQSLGADQINQYSSADFFNCREKFDLIFDAVGKYKKSKWQHLLKESGRFVTVAEGYATESLAQLQMLKDLFESGDLKAVIDKTYYLDEIIDAHRYVDSGRKKGNVVVKIFN